MKSEERLFNDMQSVKRDFYAMRNGIVAATLRQGGSPFRIIFGLNLPQLSDIAESRCGNSDLAERLWNNSTTRESMLLAPMIVDRNSFSIDDARRWIAVVPSYEVADVLCLKLLRHQDYARRLAEELVFSHEKMKMYVGLRLMFNLLHADPEGVLSVLQCLQPNEIDSFGCRHIVSQMKDECDYLRQV